MKITNFSEEADIYVINTCSVTENADKECELIEEYIPIEKDNIQNIAGTGLEVSGVKLRPTGCAWNSERGWHKPTK